MPRKQKPSWIVEAHGVRVRVFKKGAFYWYDLPKAGDRPRERSSLRTTERSTAESQAKAFCTELAKQALSGVSSATLTLGQLFATYMEKKGRSLKPRWHAAAKTRIELFLAAWKSETPVASVSETSVADYCAKRRSGEVAPKLRAKRLEAKLDVEPLRDGALDADFSWLSSVFNWATKHKLASGARLLDRNPLHDCENLPHENNVRRPIASHDRYVQTLAKVDEVDPAGRLRLILVLAYETGRREGSIISLRASDVLLTPARIAEALAAEGMDVGRASEMPFGALRWRSENDKTEKASIVGISEEARAAVDAYLGRHARIGEAPLFPGPRKDAQPVSRVIAYRWLMAAERLAELPKLRRGGWHPYRRLFATSMRGLPDKDIMSAAGWKSAKTLAIYQQSDDAGVLAVLKNRQRERKETAAQSA